MKDSTLAWTFMIYTLVYEAIVLGGTGYAVFVLGHSGWWFLLAGLLSGSQLMPDRWRQLFGASST